MHAAPVNASTLEWDTSTAAAEIEDNEAVVAAEGESVWEMETARGRGRGAWVCFWALLLE